MKRSIYIIIVIFLACISSLSQSSYEAGHYSVSLNTVGGTITSITGGDTTVEGDQPFIEINRRMVYKGSKGQRLDFLNVVYEFGKINIVFIHASTGSNSSGGSNKVAGFYKAATIRSDGSVSISPSEFIGTGALPKITRKQNYLIIRFPPAPNMMGGSPVAQTWIWQDGEVKKLENDNQ